MALLLGISGQAGVGKTTAANVFVDSFNFVELSFADPIKRAARNWWGFTDTQLWGASEERNKPDERYPLKTIVVKGRSVGATTMTPALQPRFLTPRHSLQQIGDLVRKIDPEVWLRLGLNIANKILDNPGSTTYTKEHGVGLGFLGQQVVNGVVFADVRYINEINKTKEAGGTLIRIKRPTASLEGAYAAHASESGQLDIPDDLFDFVIDNDGTLEEFMQNIKDVAQELGFSSQLDLF